LQTARVLCGFGAVQQNAQLDTAAKLHAQYLAHLSVGGTESVLSHWETVTTDPYYRGYAPWDRSSVAGYGIYVGEILAATWLPYNTSNPPAAQSLEQRGRDAMLNLMNTVYHLTGAMYYGHDVGFGAELQTWSSGTSRREEFRLGSLNGFQNPHQDLLLGTGNLASYPCQGSTDIPSSFAPADESPNPFPSITDRAQLVGPPIYLKVDIGHILVVTSYSIKQNNTVLPATMIDWAYDQSVAREVGQNEVFLVPIVALTPNQTYQVTVNGTIDGTPFSTRSFGFSTGS
jgi:hypothetical protein